MGEGCFNLPSELAIDSAGYVYVADTGNNRIQKFTSGGTFVTMWGRSGSGDGEFDNPTSVVTDGIYVYVLDQGNRRIQKFGEQ